MYVCIYENTQYTVEPLSKDSPNKGHHINYFPTKDTFKAPQIDFPIVLILFSPLKSGQPLYSGQISWSQCVLHKEVPLHIYVCTYICIGTSFYWCNPYTYRERACSIYIKYVPFLIDHNIRTYVCTC